jgi:hypothetical protein
MVPAMLERVCARAGEAVNTAQPRKMADMRARRGRTVMRAPVMASQLDNETES